MFRLALTTALVGAILVVPGTPAGAGDEPLPVVSPTPQQVSRAGRDVALPDRVRLATGPDTDPVALGRLEQVLRAARVRTGTGPAALTIRLGAATREDIKADLGPTRAQNTELNLAEVQVYGR